MYDIQLSERNIVIEKSKHLGLIGVFVQQNYSQINAPRVQTSAVIHSFIHIRLINIRNIALNKQFFYLLLLIRSRETTLGGSSISVAAAAVFSHSSISSSTLWRHYHAA